MQVNEIWYGQSYGYNMSININFYRVKKVTKSGRWRLVRLGQTQVIDKSKEFDGWIHHYLYRPTDEVKSDSILVTLEDDIYYSKSTKETLHKWDGNDVKGCWDSYS